MDWRITPAVVAPVDIKLDDPVTFSIIRSEGAALFRIPSDSTTRENGAVYLQIMPSSTPESRAAFPDWPDLERAVRMIATTQFQGQLQYVSVSQWGKTSDGTCTLNHCHIGVMWIVSCRLGPTSQTLILQGRPDSSYPCQTGMLEAIFTSRYFSRTLRRATHSPSFRIRFPVRLKHGNGEASLLTLLHVISPHRTGSIVAAVSVVIDDDDDDDDGNDDNDWMTMLMILAMI